MAAPRSPELTTGYHPTYLRHPLSGGDNAMADRDRCPSARPEDRVPQPGRDVLGPDHPDRRQPGHLHQDRLRQPAGRRVPQHLVDLPRLQHLHEGQGPARRPLHHQPDLRHLRRQPRHLRLLRPEHGLRHQARRAMGEWIVNLGEAAEYMFDHNIFQDNLVGVDFCEQMVKETNPGVWAKAEQTAGPARRHARLPHDRRHHAGAESVHRRVLPRGAPDEPPDAARCSA